jgi:hypothetical protein
VSCFTVETRSVPMLGVSENSDETPNTRGMKVNTFKYTGDARRDKESPKDCSNLKSCDPVTRALTPPFIEKRRDFYIPKVPSNLRNILNVNTYMNVFYISYIYKLATSSHAKPGLFEVTSLTWLLAGSRVSHLGNLHMPRLPNSDFSGFPNSALPISWSRMFMIPGLHRIAASRASQVQGSRFSQVRDSRASQVQGSRFSQVRDFSFAGSRLKIFASSRLPSFAGSRFQISDLRKFTTSGLRSFKIPENSLHEFHYTRRFDDYGFS